MPRCRVVEPKIERLHLSEGDWVDVVNELNAGDYADLLTAMMDRQKFAKPIAYILGWSLVGLENAPLPYSRDLPENERRDILGSLDKGTMRELVAAIDKHEAAQDAIRDGKKKATPTAPASSPTSLSAAP